MMDGAETATSFEFATATRIVFGAGTLRDVAPAAAAMESRALVVTGGDAERAAPLLDGLRAAGVAHEVFAQAGEPTIESVDQAVRAARKAGCGIVIGMGGGSALDTAKAVAALLPGEVELMDHLEVIGRGRPLGARPAPCIAVPTTAGTGSEVTRNAVLASPEHGLKVSLRSPMMLPDLAVVDPELTLSLPAAITASTGLDALTQLIEPFLSRRANPMTDGFCREGIPRAARSLARACRSPEHLDARGDMAMASLLGGLALAGAGLGAVHGLASPLGGQLGMPHGAVCAALLPVVLEVNLAALRARAPGHPSLGRFDELAVLLTGDPEARAADGVDWIRGLCAELAVPGLSEFGLTRNSFATVARQAQGASSMKANPIPLDDAELLRILEESSAPAAP